MFMKSSLFITAVAWVLGAVGPADAATQASEDGEWSMPAKDYASTRYSGLAQITSSNATTLHPVWTFSTGVLAGHEGQPLVVKDTMYVITPWPNVLYAFDLSKEGYPLRWKYRPAGGAKRLRGFLQLLGGNLNKGDLVGSLHDMRFVFLDNDTKLLFATTYDGDRDAYIDMGRNPKDSV